MTDAPIKQDVSVLYRNRFPPSVLANRQAVWRILCREWLARYISPETRVLDIAGGYCEFINNIQARERTVVDMNPDTASHAAPDVTVKIAGAEDLDTLFAADRFDVAFTSNFFEHCRSREQMLTILKAVHTVLKPGGRFLILGPNFRYCSADYFDFFDHHLPLTDRSMAEALGLAGFHIERVLPQTLPFSFKSGLPSWPWLVSLYLKLPWTWRWFGKQFFVVAVKPETGP